MTATSVMGVRCQTGYFTSMTEFFYRHPAKIAVSQEMLADMQIDREFMYRIHRELMLDLTVGPRYGPPVPYVEPARCEHCGHLLDDWDDEEED